MISRCVSGHTCALGPVTQTSTRSTVGGTLHFDMTGTRNLTLENVTCLCAVAAVVHDPVNNNVGEVSYTGDNYYRDNYASCLRTKGSSHRGEEAGISRGYIEPGPLSILMPPRYKLCCTRGKLHQPGLLWILGLDQIILR